MSARRKPAPRAAGATRARRRSVLRGAAGAPASASGWTPARLMAEAEAARSNAYAPYSRFHVGAALLARDGTVYTGCNVENASFGLAICGERNALFGAVADGQREFVAVAVTAGENGGASPCGACRQVLYEFSPGMMVYWRDGAGRIVKRPLRRLLEQGFVFARKGR